MAVLYNRNMTGEAGDKAPRRFRDEEMVRQVKDGQALTFWIKAFPNYGMEPTEVEDGMVISEFGKFERSRKKEKQPIDIDVEYAIAYAGEMVGVTESARMSEDNRRRELFFWQVRRQIGERDLPLISQRSPHRK